MKNNKEVALVILAAGMGSRFGGLKQLEPFGPNKEFIIDYSIYDAIKAGYNKVYFIIKEENYDLFRDTVGIRIENKIDVEYIFQNNDNISNIIDIPSDRVKPFGTGHALMCLKDKVKENFVMINADDFYGYNSFKLAYDYIKNIDETSYNYGLIGYDVEKTLTENGSVKRGICEVNNNYLTKLIESSIEKIDGKLIAAPLDNSENFVVAKDSLVSMNMLCFTPTIINYLCDKFVEFADVNKNNLDKCEYLIPDVVFDMIKNNKAEVKVIKTDESWYGVTYKEDKESVINAINNMIDNNIYPINLWNN